MNRRLHPCQVDLVYDMDLDDILRQAGDDLAVVRYKSAGRVRNHQCQVCAPKLPPGALDAKALNLVSRFAQARGVDYVQRHTLDRNRFADCVAGRTRNRSNNGALFARQAIEQARLAHVRPAGEHDVDS